MLGRKKREPDPPPVRPTRRELVTQLRVLADRLIGLVGELADDLEEGDGRA